MSRPKKEESLGLLDQPQPIKVEILEKEKPNPNEGKFPKWNEVDQRPKKRYVFSYLQQPGSVHEATPGVTVIKNNGKTGTHYEKYRIEDGEEVELPVDIVERWRPLTYFHEGKPRPRFSFVEV